MTDPRAGLGARGESLVCAEYAADGYAVLAQNWSCKVGELDVVVARDRVIVFVEVRTVSTDYLDDPSETVMHGKQSKVARAADQFLQQSDVDWENIRFDVASVVLESGGPRIQRFENAFVPNWAF